MHIILSQKTHTVLQIFSFAIWLDDDLPMNTRNGFYTLERVKHIHKLVVNSALSLSLVNENFCYSFSHFFCIFTVPLLTHN